MTAHDASVHADGSGAELRSAAALILTIVSIVAAALGVAWAADGFLVLGLLAGIAALGSFIVSMACFSADAEATATERSAEVSAA